MEFTFEQSPWEAALQDLERGASISAATLLTLCPEEADLEDAFAALEEKEIALDIQGLPLPVAEGEAAVRLRQEQQLAQQPDLLAALEESDPLRVYLEELAQIPAAGDIDLLAQNYLAGDESAVQMLTNLSLHKVVELARQLTGRGVLLMDLIQEASLGLWQGILQYTGGDFECHRDWWIRQYLARAVTLQARCGGLGQKLRQDMEDYRDTDQKLLMELGRNPTREEIAQAMHTTGEAVATLEEMLRTARLKNAAQQEPEEDEQEAQQAVEDTAYFQSRQRIQELLSNLSEEEAKLLSLRFGLEGGLPLNPEQTGKKLGMTPDEVVNTEAAALAKLRLQS